jgi:TonB-linked SusC/RagA family outer membrane protein
MLRTLFRRAGPGVLGALVALLFATTAFAQEGAITGTVVNSQTLEPVNGAQVFIPGTEFGTLTDREGRYRLVGVPAGAVTVEVRLIGYRDYSTSVTVVAGEATTLDIELPVSAVRLEDVTVNVVTGLERRRRQLGTNSGEIDAAAVNKGAVTDFSDLLSGRSEGVIFNESSGDAGAGQRIRIRGSSSLSLNNDPLVIVDGIYFHSANSNPGTGGVYSGIINDQGVGTLNDLNPEEIASIEIVKGPSAAALYGAVGANGAIIITTKRGEAGGTDFTFYAEGGVLNDVTDWPDSFVAAESIGDPSAPVIDEDGFNTTDWSTCRNVDAAAGTCTQDQFLQFNGMTDPRTTPYVTGDRQAYGLNVSGGTQQATYFVSGEFEREDGILPTNLWSADAGQFYDLNQERKWNVRANVDAALSDDVDASVSVGYVPRDVWFVSNDNSLYSPIINAYAGLAGYAPGRASNGGPNRSNYLFARNIVDIAEATDSKVTSDRFTGSANGRWQALDWLSAQGTFGVDILSTFNQTTIQPGLDGLTSSWVDGFREGGRFQRYTWTGNASLSADINITGDLESTSTAGAAYANQIFNGLTCFGDGLIQGLESCDAVSGNFAVAENFLDVVTLGAFFQQEFGWRDRLFVTGAVRIDDDSNFGGEASLQVYPSASVSWLLSEEDFFSTEGFISELRLRGSFGVAGLRPAFRDAITLFAPVTATVETGNNPGVTLSETGNELLKPERATEWEAGLDVGLFNDRIGLAGTYFFKSSKDALIERQIAPSFGLTTSLFDNLGEIQNRGIEASLRALAVDTRDIRVDLTLQFTSLKNEIIDLGEGVEPIIFGFSGSQRHENGFAAGGYFEPGSTFNDANGDGLLSRDEVTTNDVSCDADPDACFIDESIPLWTSSLSADLEFFQFIRVNTLFDARGGHSLVFYSEDFRCRRLNQGHGCEATGSPNASLEDQAAIISRFGGDSARFVEDAKFLKWRELSVTLTAPPSIRDVHPLLERTSVTFAGRNLQTWTPYPGLDPEINSQGGRSNFNQSDFNTQPPIQVFTLRLDVRF